MLAFGSLVDCSAPKDTRNKVNPNRFSIAVSFVSFLLNEGAPPIFKKLITSKNLDGV